MFSGENLPDESNFNRKPAYNSRREAKKYVRIDLKPMVSTAGKPG